jgi:hypothetical protein
LPQIRLNLLFSLPGTFQFVPFLIVNAIVAHLYAKVKN